MEDLEEHFTVVFNFILQALEVYCGARLTDANEVQHWTLDRRSLDKVWTNFEETARSHCVKPEGVGDIGSRLMTGR